MSDQYLTTLFSTLSQLAARSATCALRATKDRQPEARLLFSALSRSLAAQAKRMLHQMHGRIAATEENMHRTGEDLAMVAKQLNTLATTAMAAGNQALGHAAQQSRRVQLKNGALLRQLEQGAVIGPQGYAVCGFCGYVHAGAPPDRCPICAAAAHRFSTV